MGKLDIKFLGGIESKKHNTSLGGSCQLYTYQIQGEIFSVLLDIGSFVGMPSSLAPDQTDAIDLTKLKAIIITHVHNDHIGRLPELVKAGYRNPIYMTPLSARLSDPIFDDALKIQRAQIAATKEQNKRLGGELQRALASLNTPQKRDMLNEPTIKKYTKLLDQYGIKKNSDIKNVLKEIPEDPAFDEHDIMQTLAQIRPIEYGQEIDLIKGVRKTKFINAGHVPGAAQVIMRFHQQKYKDKLYFNLLNTGDLGRSRDNFLLESPEIPTEKINATVIEGTYGGRMHAERKKEVDDLTDAINKAEDLFVLPAFSLQRFQEIMLALWAAKKDGSLQIKKNEKIYCTSPLAYEFTKILIRENPEKYAFLSDNIFYRIQSKEDEDMLKNIKNRRKIVIAGGGMIQGGSSVKYAQYAIQNPKAHIRLTGYQGEGTFGRELLEKSGTTETVKLSHVVSPIRSSVRQLKSFSSHADEQELVDHMTKINLTPDHRTIITHGGDQRFDLKQAMQRADIKTSYIIPDIYDTISIDTTRKQKRR